MVFLGAVGGGFIWFVLQIDYGFRSIDPPLLVDLLGVGAFLLAVASGAYALYATVRFERLQPPRSGAAGDLDWLRVRAGALSDELGPEPAGDPAGRDAHRTWVSDRRLAVRVLVDAAGGDPAALWAAAEHAYATTEDARVAGLLADASRTARARVSADADDVA